MTPNSIDVRHNILDALELMLLTETVNLPAFGFVEINTWFSNLDDRRFDTPNGSVKVTKHGVCFTHNTDPSKNRVLFELGLDGTNVFQRARAYETWMFFRFAPLNLVRFRELNEFANSLLRK